MPSPKDGRIPEGTRKKDSKQDVRSLVGHCVHFGAFAVLRSESDRLGSDSSLDCSDPASRRVRGPSFIVLQNRTIVSSTHRFVQNPRGRVE